MRLETIKQRADFLFVFIKLEITESTRKTLRSYSFHFEFGIFATHNISSTAIIGRMMTEIHEFSKENQRNCN